MIKKPYSETKKHFSTNCFCSISTTVGSLPPKQRPMRGLERSNLILLCFLKIIYLNELYIVLSDRFLFLIEKWFYVVIHTVYKTSTWIASDVHWRNMIFTYINWLNIANNTSINLAQSSYGNHQNIDSYGYHIFALNIKKLTTFSYTTTKFVPQHSKAYSLDD